MSQTMQEWIDFVLTPSGSTLAAALITAFATMYVYFHSIRRKSQKETSTQQDTSQHGKPEPGPRPKNVAAQVDEAIKGLHDEIDRFHMMRLQFRPSMYKVDDPKSPAELRRADRLSAAVSAEEAKLKAKIDELEQLLVRLFVIQPESWPETHQSVSVLEDYLYYTPRTRLEREREHQKVGRKLAPIRLWCAKHGGLK